MQEATEQTEAKVKRGARTCVGCGAVVPPSDAGLVRLVQDDSGGGAVALVVDAAGGAFGRGVHLHATPSCVERAVKGGLAKSLRAAIAPITAAELAAAICEAYARRATALVATAHRKRDLAVGADASVDALAADAARVVVVANDAAHAATLGPVQAAAAAGRALVWTDKSTLGKALGGRDAVAVAVVTDAGLGRALLALVTNVVAPLSALASKQAAGAAADQDSRGEACRSREVR